MMAPLETRVQPEVERTRRTPTCRPRRNIQTQPTLTSTLSSVNRVCDRCMVRKVKCRRPTCSRCQEGGWSCTYSSIKKKPGPPKGARSKASSIQTSPLRNGRSLSSHVEGEPFLESAQYETASVQLPLTDHTVCLQGDSLVPSLDMLNNQTTPFQPRSVSTADGYQTRNPNPILPTSIEIELLEYFFDHLQPSLPIFRKSHFYGQYEKGALSHNLLTVMFAMSAQRMPNNNYWTETTLRASLEYFIEMNSINEEDPSSSVSIDDLRQCCLLAFYEFHQLPGRRAWTRISRLTRKAYQCGLHRIDDNDWSIMYGFGTLSPIEIENWRYVWWCIFCLDSYCNITAATPFGVEADGIRTALTTPEKNIANDEVLDKTTSIFLPSETESVWKIIKSIVTLDQGWNFNMHIITTYILRESATVCRLCHRNPSDRLRRRRSALEDDISNILLSLPALYLNPTRMVWSNESHVAHLARLVCILHIHVSRILIFLSTIVENTATGLPSRWSQSLVYCEDVVNVVRNWDAQFTSTVDPAICFIIWITLTKLDLHARSKHSHGQELTERLLSHKTMLILLLEQFAALWQLPRMLLASFVKFQEALPEFMDGEEIRKALIQLQGWLDPRMLQALHDNSKQPSTISIEDASQEDVWAQWELFNWQTDLGYKDPFDLT